VKFVRNLSKLYPFSDLHTNMLISKRTVHELALNGDVLSVKEMVMSKPVCIKTKDDSGRLPLHWAVSKGHTELSAWLLDQTKEADVPDESGWTPLIIAASAGHQELAALLLDNGADINRTTDQGRTALLYAASKGRSELVSLLINKGADVNKADQLGATPLHRAAGPGHSDVVRLLLAADNTIVDCQDRYGNTALHTACEEERTEVAKLLISHGASREIQNREEKSPLEMCSPQFARGLKS